MYANARVFALWSVLVAALFSFGCQAPSTPAAPATTVRTAAPSPTAAPISPATVPPSPTSIAPATAAPATRAPTATAVPPATATRAATPAPVASATAAALRFQPGRNDYTIQVDGARRQFIVHVPRGYNPARATPLLFMFHGSSQGGQLFYENSGWVPKADSENFIAVFPTALEYFVVEENRRTEKWSSRNLPNQVPPGTEIKDDVNFVREMVRLSTATWNIDRKRIFGSGFSNGAGFVYTRLAIEMADTFAAFGTAGSIPTSGGPPLEGTALVSIYGLLGTDDRKLEEGGAINTEITMEPAQIAEHPELKPPRDMLLQKLQLSAEYSAEVERPWFTTLTYNKSLVGAGNEFKFRIIRSMGHLYPNGQNNQAKLSAPDLFWPFFTQHPKQ